MYSAKNLLQASGLGQDCGRKAIVDGAGSTQDSLSKVSLRKWKSDFYLHFPCWSTSNDSNNKYKIGLSMTKSQQLQ